MHRRWWMYCVALLVSETLCRSVAAQHVNMPLPARGTIEGLTSPNRVPGGDFVVIFERSEIRALANPALLERSRFRSPERLAADEAGWRPGAWCTRDLLIRAL
jgi:hypothetical protein